MGKKLTREYLIDLIKEVFTEEVEYQKVINEAAEKFGVTGKLHRLTEDSKKKFYTYVDKQYALKMENVGCDYMDDDKKEDEKEEEMDETLEFPDFKDKGMDRVKAQKRKQILKKGEVQEGKESDKDEITEQRIREIIQEELTFLMFNEVPATKGRKRAKRNKKLSGDADLP